MSLKLFHELNEADVEAQANLAISTCDSVRSNPNGYQISDSTLQVKQLEWTRELHDLDSMLSDPNFSLSKSDINYAKTVCKFIPIT